MDLNFARGLVTRSAISLLGTVLYKALEVTVMKTIAFCGSYTDPQFLFPVFRPPSVLLAEFLAQNTELMPLNCLKIQWLLITFKVEAKLLRAAVGAESYGQWSPTNWHGFKSHLCVFGANYPNYRALSRKNGANNTYFVRLF